jgi:hypothetical protein
MLYYTNIKPEIIIAKLVSLDKTIFIKDIFSIILLIAVAFSSINLDLYGLEALVIIPAGLITFLYLILLPIYLSALILSLLP